MKNEIVGKVSATVNAPVSKVWQALVKPELIKKYFFGTNTITDWKVGSPITFKGEWEGKSYEDKGKILMIETNKVLSYNYWSSISGIEDIPENYVIVTYELEGKGDHTEINITQENIPTEKMRIHSEKNWQMVLNNLKEFLETER